MAFPSDAAARTRGYLRVLSAWAIFMSCYEHFRTNWSPSEVYECPSLEDVVEHLFDLRHEPDDELS